MLKFFALVFQTINYSNRILQNRQCIYIILFQLLQFYMQNSSSHWTHVGPCHAIAVL